MSKLTLKDCCSFQEGYVNPSQKYKEYFDGDIKWLRASDLNDGFVFSTERKLSEKGFLSAGKSAFLFNEGTLAISKSGTIGRLGILKNKMCGNRAVINIDVDSEIANLYYVFYTLKYKKPEIISKAGGSIQKNLYISALETISLNHNDRAEQSRIAKTLFNLDQKIELNNKINAELEAMAKLIYDYWFVQFDFPDANGKPYKSSGGKMVYNEALKREIPDGWESKNVDSECFVRNGYAFKSDSYTESGYTIIRTKNFKYGSVELGDMAYISHREAESFKRYNLEKFDFLLVMVGASVGKNVVVNSNVLPALQNQNMWCFRSKHSVQHFANQLLKWIVLEQLSTSSGSAREFFKKEVFKEATFASPSTELKEFYCEKVEPLLNRIDVIRNENQTLIELRDWLLPMLMNGQVTVKDV